MARLARVVAVGVPHHITQRGNGRRFILASDAEQTVYTELLRQAVQLHSLPMRSALDGKQASMVFDE
jgi:putative transposase